MDFWTAFAQVAKANLNLHYGQSHPIVKNRSKQYNWCKWHGLWVSQSST